MELGQRCHSAGMLDAALVVCSQRKQASAGLLLVTAMPAAERQPINKATKPASQPASPLVSKHAHLGGRILAIQNVYEDLGQQVLLLAGQLLLVGRVQRLDLQLVDEALDLRTVCGISAVGLDLCSSI